ncbi:MAG: hypothetical protein ACRDZX_12680 [Acidimicrobiales bacterium]
MTRKHHFTYHHTSRHGDALDLFDDESATLRAAFAEWETTMPDANPGEGRSEAPAKWDNGTLGKLLLEHGAVWLAAARDVARALSSGGDAELAAGLARRAEQVRGALDQMDEAGRGLQPIAVATNVEYARAAADLREALGPQLGDRAYNARLATNLGARRQQLRTARYIRKHAPTHPGPARRYRQVGPLVRAQTAFDRARGFPWAESAPLSSEDIAERYDKEG